MQVGWSAGVSTVNRRFINLNQGILYSHRITKRVTEGRSSLNPVISSGQNGSMRWHTWMPTSTVLPATGSYAYGCAHPREFSTVDLTPGTHRERGNLNDPIFIVLSFMLCA